MKAQFNTPLKGQTVRCDLCPHHCTLEAGKTGICRTHTNVAGELQTLAYGAVCAAHVDPMEKKPLFHFLPGSRIFSVATAGCNLRCQNCQNVQISQHGSDEVLSERLSPQQIVEAAIQHDCQSIAYTYTDPVVYYEYAYDTACVAHLKGLKNVIVSAGYINELPLRQWCRVMDAANIDLKSMDDAVYRHLCGATLAPVLRTLEVLKNEGVWLEITRLMVPGMTDGADDIALMCDWLVAHGMAEVPLHLSRFFPHHQLMHLAPTPVAKMQLAYRIARDAGIKYVYLGNVTIVGTENTFCPVCSYELVSRNGFDVRSNRIEKGHCPQCGNAIAGVWQ